MMRTVILLSHLVSLLLLLSDINVCNCDATTTSFKCKESKIDLTYSGKRCTIEKFRQDKHNFAGINAFNIKELKFIDSHFRQIPQTALKMYEHIESLEVENVGLLGLEPGCLYHARNLKKFIAPFNKITKLEELTFIGARNLMWINMSHNSIIRMHPKVFQNLTKLEVLDLNYNRITSLDKLIFLNQKSLHSIFLNNNQLVTIDPYIFHMSETLESLLLNDNYLDQLKLHLRNNHITYLYAMNNRIKKFYLDADNKDFEDHNFYIELRKNKIQTFYVSSRLNPTYLSISSNNLSYIGNITQISSLKYLDLSYNRLEFIMSVAFQNLTHLEELYMSGVGISSLDDDYFSNLKNMKRLVISDNEINEIEIEKLSLPEGIEEIDLSHNNLSSFEMKHLSKTMPKLIRLDLSNNPLTIKKINELAVGHTNIIVMNDSNEVTDDNDDDERKRYVDKNLTYVQQKLANVLMELHQYETNARHANLSNYRRIENSENHLKVLNLFLIFLLIVVLCLFVFTIYLYVTLKTKSF